VTINFLCKDWNVTFKEKLPILQDELHQKQFTQKLEVDILRLFYATWQAELLWRNEPTNSCQLQPPM
jgi:hypothetical protein